MRVSTVDAIIESIVVGDEAEEVVCGCDDGRVATHVLRPMPCVHVYCLEHTGLISRLLERLGGRASTIVQCDHGLMLFGEATAKLVLVPFRGRS